jgi:hypothetical protein
MQPFVGPQRKNSLYDKERLLPMYRIVSLFIAIVMLFSMAACSLRTQGVPDKSQKALFVGRESGGDAIVIKHLKALGFQVDVIADKELTAEKALGHSLVFVSSTVNSGKVSSKLKASPIPVVYAESQNMGDIDLSGRETDTDNGDFVGKTVRMRADSHPIASGLKGNVDIYKQDGKIGFIVPSKEGVIIASAPDNDKKAVICIFEKGAKNMSSESVPARQAYFYLVGGEEINQTDNGWKLFDATVRWVIGSK